MGFTDMVELTWQSLSGFKRQSVVAEKGDDPAQYKNDGTFGSVNGNITTYPLVAGTPETVHRLQGILDNSGKEGVSLEPEPRKSLER